jgi:hypothetical protein
MPALVDGFNLYTIINVFIYIALVIYFVYTLLVLRQVQIMTATFDLPGERLMKLFGIMHSLLVAAILLLAFAIL